MYRFRIFLRRLLSAVAVFFLLLLLGAVVPRNADFHPTPGGVPIYVTSNGFHTDLVVPLRDSATQIDWFSRFPADSNWRQRFGNYQYVAFGWGNEAFYLESYGGRFPNFGTIIRALAPARTLMHVDFYRRAPREGDRVARVVVSAAQYQALAAYIRQSFAPDTAGHWVLRNAKGYTSEDFFFRAQGSYHALRTCNDWTNRGLQRAGVRAALKAPMAAAVLYQVKRAE